MKSKVVFVLSLLALGVSANAGDWPEFRGPGKQGHTEQSGLPVSWDTEKNVVWKKPVPGAGWSSPVVADGKIFMTSAMNVDGEGELDPRILCYDVKTGVMLFNHRVFKLKTEHATKKHKKNGFASPTPIVRDGKVYVHFGHMGTACVDTSGKLVWKNQDLDYSPVHGNGGSPELVGDALIFSRDGKDNPNVVALHKDTGKVLWTHERDSNATRKFSFSTPLTIEVAGKQQVITCGSGEVSALDPATGREIWEADYDQGYSVIPRPVYGHGMIFIATGYNKPNVLAIRVDGKGDVTNSHVAWINKRSAPHTPSLLQVGNELYMVSDGGIASCLDAHTGDVHWSERLGGNYSASPLYGEGRVYFQSEQGEGIVIKAGKEFEVLSRNDLGEKTFASYAVVGSDFIIRTETQLYRIGKDGAL